MYLRLAGAEPTVPGGDAAVETEAVEAELLGRADWERVREDVELKRVPIPGGGDLRVVPVEGSAGGRESHPQPVSAQIESLSGNWRKAWRAGS
jgi:hypothetical protein